jgi:predicted PurR-regulated permease PerM
VLAILLTLLLRPVFRRLRRLRVPDFVAGLVIISLVAALFVGGLLTVAQQGQSWLAEAPETVQKVGRMMPRRAGPIDDLEKTSDAVRKITQSDNADAPVPVEVRSTETTFSLLGASGHFLASALVVFVLAFFLLSFSDTLLKQAVESCATFSHKRNIVALLQNVEQGISRYLMTISIINVGLGIVTAAVAWALGIPNPVMWGVVAAILNYVPHVGAMLCMVLLFLAGAVAHENLWSGVAAAAAFCLLTTAESYFITPFTLSKSLQLSPLAVIVSILFFGWLWGVAGGLMAAPLLAVIKIVADQFEGLRPLAILLSGHTAATNGAAAAAEKNEPVEVPKLRVDKASAPVPSI